LRKDRKLTQEAFAAKIKLSSKYLSKIENSRVDPSFSSLFKIAKGFDLTVAQLVAEPSDTWVEVERKLRSATKAERERVLVVLEALLRPL
jgi:transcriptional regulator with XRE-family HTH domain